jgi:hypothetical protein
VTRSNEVEQQKTGDNTQVNCDKPDCVNVRAERDLLLSSIKDLTHAQLIARDMELGLRAELMQARIDVEHARARGAHDLAQTRKSITWRVGRLVMSPLAISKSVLRRIKK